MKLFVTSTLLILEARSVPLASPVRKPNTAIFCRVAVLVSCVAAFSGCGREEVRFGAKNFPESQILAEMLWHVASVEGAEVGVPEQLGDTPIVWNALLQGEIDAYIDYTGTVREETLRTEDLETDEQVRAALEKRGILMSDPLGFNNTYAIGMLDSRAEELGITKISDLTNHPNLRLYFSTAFKDREDCWPALKRAYNLPYDETQFETADHAVTYQAIENGSADVIDLYATDAELATDTYRKLEDDRGVFPEYNAVILYRADFAKTHSTVVESLRALVGSITEEEMRRLNTRVKTNNENPNRVAGEYLIEKFPQWEEKINERISERDIPLALRVARSTLDHLLLVGISLGAAVFVGVPVGVFAARRPRAGQVALGVVGIVQTIPSLALLVLLMVPLAYFGITSVGAIPAVVALFLYSLLPIVRNTVSGLQSVAPAVRESAQAVGLSPRDQLWLIELPLASRTIMAGIKTAAVINVGFATLGALIGAGGYGQPIMQGIASQNYALIMEGAVPAALLAVAVQQLFEGLERWIVPRGLRLAAAR